MSEKVTGIDIVFDSISIAFKIAIGAAVLGGGAYMISPDPARDTAPDRTSKSNTAADTCTAQNTRQLPAPANVRTVVDTRMGNIYPCQYLNDLGLPSNTPTALGKINSEVYDEPSADFQQTGSLDGFAILGTGFLSGEITASGSNNVERKRVYAIQAEGTDGAFRTMILDAEKVAIRPCKEETTCQPSVEFVVSDDPLWYKDQGTDNIPVFKSQEPDHTSIWSESGVHEGTRLNGTRVNVVNQLTLGDEGGPDLPGQVVSNLSSQIVLTLPKSAM